MSGADRPTVRQAGRDDGEPVDADAPTLDSPSGPHPPAGATFGRYQVVGLLGAGGMGVVLCAEDPELQRRIAVKVVRPDDGPDDRARARLLREARAMARLSHPNVVPIYDVGVVGDDVFIAMELVEGTNLRRWLGGDRSWRDILDAYVQAGRGLVAAHDAGMVHRDFKPENVLIGEDGRVRVGDFGLVSGDAPARTTRVEHVEVDDGDASDSALTRKGEMLGTPAYLPPEIIRGEPADHRADQFSFCVALFTGLYGMTPYRGTSLSERAAEIAAGNLAEAPDTAVPPAVYEILVRGLSSNPGDRFPSMVALLSALANATTPPRTSPPRRARWIAAGGAVVAIGAVAIVWRASRGGAADPCATEPPGSRTEFFVAAGAEGGATGSRECPYPIISDAIAAANLSSATDKTIHVAAGTYDASHERFPLVLRGGVSLIGDGAQITSIVGAGLYDHAEAGGTISGPVWVGVLVGDPLGAQAVRGVSLRPDQPHPLSVGIYCDQGNAYPPPADRAVRDPSVSFDALDIAGFDTALVIGTSDAPVSGCNARLTRSRITSGNVGVFVVGAGADSNVPNRVSAEIGDGTEAAANTFVDNRKAEDRRDHPDDPGYAILVYDHSTPLSIRRNQFLDNEVGIALVNHTTDATADVEDNTFSGTTGAAVLLKARYNLRSLIRNQFVRNMAPPDSRRITCGDTLTRAVALCVDGAGAPGPQIQRARGNTFTSNDVGIYVAGAAFSPGESRQFDFGAAGDPGGNLFLCNSSEQPDAPGADVWFDVAGDGVTIPFTGNAWDHAPPTTSAPGAHDRTDVVLGASAPRLDLTDSELHGLGCTAPHGS